jgi:hypothetical protein
VRIWDLRAPGCQRSYESRAAVNSVQLHPNQGELISGAEMAHLIGALGKSTQARHAYKHAQGL